MADQYFIEDIGPDSEEDEKNEAYTKLVDQMTDYKTKLERIDISKKVNTSLVNTYMRGEYKSKVLRSAADIIDSITGLLDVDVAISISKSLVAARHDAWVEFIEKTLVKTSGMTYCLGDTRFSTFLYRAKIITQEVYDSCNSHYKKPRNADSDEEFNIYLENHGLPPIDILKLTPDIQIKKGSNYYIGDVSVMNRSSKDAREMKENKYNPLIDWLVQSNKNAVKLNFIIGKHEPAALITNLHNKNLTKPNHAIEAIYKQSYILINKALNLIGELVCDKESYDAKIQKDIKENIIIYDIPAHHKIRPVREYVPRYTEDEIINDIKMHVESINMDTIFDTVPEHTQSAFEKLMTIQDPNKPVEPPKPVLKVVSNCKDVERNTGFELIKSYITDSFESESDEADYMRFILPKLGQVNLMKKIYEARETNESIKANKKYRENNVFGHSSFETKNCKINLITSKMLSQLEFGKKNPNIKTEPATLDKAQFPDYINFIDNSIKYYGSQSDKPCFLDDTWDSSTGQEAEASKIEREVYNQVRHTNGAQLCHSMSSLYNKIVHTGIQQSCHNLVFVPPNASFIAIIPKRHGSFNKSSCDVPFIFITRSKEPLDHIEYEYTFKTPDYHYYISKLCRLNIQKITNWDNAGYKLCASASYIASKCRSLKDSVVETVGILTYMILDCHQKTSELSELLKYISYMPFSNMHNLPSLISDKCDLLQKTRLDAWLLNRLSTFCSSLSDKEALSAGKPKIVLINGKLTTSSTGVEMSLPSFINPSVRHTEPTDFIEETALIHICRPKKLYGSQFMDKGIGLIGDWNKQYINEKEQHGGWADEGIGTLPFPYNSNFCYSADVIHYANKYATSQVDANRYTMHARVYSRIDTTYMHYTCSLRGCTKEKHDRMNNNDLHSTSIDECLKYYKNINYDNEGCKLLGIVYDTLTNSEEDYIFQFSMSEKEQRAGGRMIATPTLRTKACLKLLEVPEQMRGKLFANNIIIPGVNKLKAQADMYKQTIARGAIEGFTKVYQVTEDQSKFSENDNINKFFPYLRTDDLVPPNVRAAQIEILSKLSTREHLVKRMPIKTIDDHPEFINTDMNGIKAIIGWPQGMLNCLSTSIHCDMDLWITHAYNKAYPDNQVLTGGLVHSDDSWVVVCCKSEEDLKKFSLFRIKAKRMACLKTNFKKYWASSMMGEMVSNYNLNGNVHMPVSKTIANSFGSLTYQNWAIDVNNQISAIQQCYRNGASVPTLILLKTILRQQMIDTYHVTGLQRELLHDLPIELGGFPSNSAFELGVSGTACHYEFLLREYKCNRRSRGHEIVLKCLESAKKNMEAGPTKKTKQIEELEVDTVMGTKRLIDDDYESICLPSRGDIFNTLHHIYPKSNKVAKTLKSLRELPFESNGLELIAPRPDEIEVALGHLKSQTSNMVYQLASEHYTESARRLAASQVIQASGKVVRFEWSKPMTINELLEMLLAKEMTERLRTDILADAFTDDTDLLHILNRVVFFSERYEIATDKRRVLNKMPYIDDKFKTSAPLQDVLLYIIDKDGDNGVYEKYARRTSTIMVIMNDAEIILRRFSSYFRYYTTLAAANLVMRQYIVSTKSRLWVQPKLENEDLSSFCESLYGSTLSEDKTYNIKMNWGNKRPTVRDTNWIDTIYSTMVLNEIYGNKFIIDEVEDFNGAKVKIDEFIMHHIDDSCVSTNSKLKLGACILRQTNTQDRIASYIRSMEFSYRYIKSQKYTPQGYSGPLIILLRMGDFVMRVKGTPGIDITIDVNKYDIWKIMNCMYQFIDGHFSNQFGYRCPNEWGLSAFWRTDRMRDDTNFGLCYYSAGSTTLCRPPEGMVRYVPVRLDVYLCSESVDKEVTPTYILGSQMRQIKVTGNPNPKVICSIKQDLRIPYRDRVTLIPNDIDGLLTTELYKSDLIMKLTTANYCEISVGAVMDILLKSPEGLSAQPAVAFFVKMFNLLNECDISMDEYLTQAEVEELGDYELQGFLAEELTNLASQVETEDLTAVIQNYDMKIQESKKLSKHKDIKAALLNIVGRVLTCVEFDSVLSWLYHSREVMEWMRQNSKRLREEIGDKPKAVAFKEFTEETITGFDWLGDNHPSLLVMSMCYVNLNSRWWNIDKNRLIYLIRNRVPAKQSILTICEGLLETLRLSLCFETDESEINRYEYILGIEPEESDEEDLISEHEFTEYITSPVPEPSPQLDIKVCDAYELEVGETGQMVYTDYDPTSLLPGKAEKDKNLQTLLELMQEAIDADLELANQPDPIVVIMNDDDIYADEDFDIFD